MHDNDYAPVRPAPPLSHVWIDSESERPPIRRTGLHQSVRREILQLAFHSGRAAGREILPPEKQVGFLKAAEACRDQRGAKFTQLLLVNQFQLVLVAL